MKDGQDTVEADDFVKQGDQTDDRDSEFDIEESEE